MITIKDRLLVLFSFFHSSLLELRLHIVQLYYSQWETSLCLHGGCIFAQTGGLQRKLVYTIRHALPCRSIQSLEDFHILPCCVFWGIFCLRPTQSSVCIIRNLQENDALMSFRFMNKI